MGSTIKEVARHAGVSTATVSRVFNNSGPVKDKTRRRVEDAARVLRYTPNSAARSLITSKTGTLGVLLPDLYGEFFSEMIRGIDAGTRESGYHLLVSGSHEDLREMAAALKAMSGRIDGLILMSPDLDAQTLEDNLPSTLPVVLINCYANGARFDAVRVDNFGGAGHIVRHLIQRGHQRVAIIKGGAGNFDADERLRGYRDAMVDAGTADTRDLEYDGDFTELSGYRMAKQILERAPRPTAIFASNDAMAIGAIRAIREAGLSIPKDVAVAGFDDIPVARYVSPALTSVHVPISRMGRLAVELLVRAIDEGERHESQRHVLPTHPVIRESCGGHL